MEKTITYDEDPTMELRWLIRNDNRILQQKIYIITNVNEIPTDIKEEWRDIPVTIE